MEKKIKIAPKLLKWYDKNARELPWRISPKESQKGFKPNPYHIWLSEIMLQQTQVKVVKSYYNLFIQKWPNIEDLAASSDTDIMEAWAGLGYYQRARRLIQCAKIITSDYNGVFPENEKLLLKLPGIGSYTAAAIRSIGFNKRSIVVDGNIARIVARLFTIETPLILSNKKIEFYANTLVPSKRFGDYAQALMDLGSLICTPKKPLCNECPIKKFCKSSNRGIENQIPKPPQKKLKPIKYGFSFVALTKTGRIILQRRPNEGLLGGMLCFPTTNWQESDAIDFEPPFEIKWHILNKPVTHIFSHFELKLKVAYGTLPIAPSGYILQPIKTFKRNSLPSLMRKVFDAAIERFPHSNFERN